VATLKSYVVFILASMLLTACYRPETRTLLLVLPDTHGNAEELDALKRYLLREQDQLRSGLTFYEDIRITPSESALEITYNRRHLADMNLVYKLNDLGYTVNDLEGDPEKLHTSRKRLELR